jgi:hypothetical protein
LSKTQNVTTLGSSCKEEASFFHGITLSAQRLKSTEPTQTTQITPVDPPATEEVSRLSRGFRVIGISAGDRLVLTIAKAPALIGIFLAFTYELVARGELLTSRLGRRVIVPNAALNVRTTRRFT